MQYKVKKMSFFANKSSLDKRLTDNGLFVMKKARFLGQFTIFRR